MAIETLPATAAPPREASVEPESALAARAPEVESHEVAAFRTRVRDFIRSEQLAEAADRWDCPDLTSPPPVRELLAALGECGILSAAIEAAGTLGAAVALHQELARLPFGGPAAAVLTQLEVGARLLRAQPESSVAAGFLARSLRGEVVVSLAVTEASGGTDLSTTASTVSPRADGLAVTGEKLFVTSAPFADLFVVLAVDAEPPSATARHSLVLVPRSCPGVSVEPIPTVGHRGFLGRVSMDEVRVPRDHRLGGPGTGLFQLTTHWTHERVMLAVRMAAMARSALDVAEAHARCRWTFGRPLASNQSVRFTLAEIAADVAEVEAICRQGVRLLERRACTAAYAAMCKYLAARTLERAADTCMQLCGGEGYRRSHPAARLLSDALGLSLAGGSDELMLTQIDRG